jgi:hypothetical protein
VAFPHRSSAGGGGDSLLPVDPIAFPIRLTADGRFLTEDPWVALTDLIKVMFATPSRVWPHAAWFGLHELVSGPNLYIVRVERALNTAFEELGVTWVSVASVDAPATGPVGERTIRLEFKVAGYQQTESRELLV